MKDMIEISLSLIRDVWDAKSQRCEERKPKWDKQLKSQGNPIEADVREMSTQLDQDIQDPGQPICLRKLKWIIECMAERVPDRIM